jgi:tetratricopeptide (TPR) repeat protein
VIELSPRYDKGYNNLGACYAEMGRLEDAVATFTETTKRFPDYPNGYRNLAMAYAALRRPRPALAAMRRYVELSPDDVEAREAVRKLEIAARADTTGAD